MEVSLAIFDWTFTMALRGMLARLLAEFTLDHDAIEWESHHRSDPNKPDIAAAHTCGKIRQKKDQASYFLNPISVLKARDHEAIKRNRIMISALYLSMICAQTLSVCRVENRLPFFQIML